MNIISRSRVPSIGLAVAIGCMVQWACVPGTASPRHLAMLMHAGEAHYARGEYQQAVAAFEQLLEIRVRELGEHHPAVAHTLNDLGVVHISRGDHARALPLLERALQIRRNTLGEGHVDVAHSLNQLANVYRVRGEYERALALRRQALETVEQGLGERHPQVAQVLNDLGVLYQEQGEHARALPLLLRALDIRKQALGAGHPDVGLTLGNLATLHRDRGEYDRAATLLEQALQILESALGPHHPHVAVMLNHQGLLYQIQGDHERALPLFQRALEANRRTFGDGPPETASAMGNLAGLYVDRGDYQRALPLCRQALRSMEKALGPDHHRVATALNNLGLLHQILGEYEHALPLLQRTLAIRRRNLGDRHPDVAVSLSSLALLHGARGEHEQALPLLDQALRMFEDSLGKHHPMVAMTLDVLGMLHHARGDDAHALPLLQRALEIRKKALGNVHRDVARSLSNLGAVYAARGEHQRALPLYQQALQTMEKALGASHPLVATELFNLAVLHHAHREYERATALLSRAREISRKALSSGHPTVAILSANLAEAYSLLGEHDPALSLFREALPVLEKSLGETNPMIALVLNGMGMLHYRRQELDLALPLFLRALEIYRTLGGNDRRDVVFPLSNLAVVYLERGEYERALPLLQQALEISEKSPGGKHPAMAMVLDNMAALHWAVGKNPEAIDYWQQLLDVTEQSLQALAFASSEDQKHARFKARHIDAVMAVGFHLAAAPDDPRVTQLTLQAVVRRKALALSAATRELQRLRREATDSNAAALVDRLARARSELAGLLLRGPEDIASYQRRTEALWREIDALEARLSRRSSGYRAATRPITVPDLQARLPAGAALVEIMLYAPVEAGVPIPRTSSKPSGYAAYVLTHDGPARAVDLGDAPTIDAAVQSLRTALAHHRANVRERARALDALVMQPVRKLLGDARQVYLSPDADLNLVPFEALLDEDGRYLVERYSFTYLNSGRELLHTPRAPTGQPPLVIADPAYADSSAPVAATTDGRRSRDMDSRTFPPLSGTAREAAVLRRLFPTATVLTGKAATETALKRAQGPFILHIGTHGFFLPDQEIGPPPERMFAPGQQGVRSLAMSSPMETPLVRSGLALAGANRLRSGSEDGLLTALELSSMNLDGTQLVVLSACDTGVGAAEIGEGVFGLRRALVLAGAETQVVSLWKVDDETTAELMAAYYGRLLAGKGRSEALHEVQRAFLRDPERAHPYYWASFIVSGNPAPLPAQVTSGSI
jgi:tetratricopeptide (TPR) repeat protein